MYRSPDFFSQVSRASGPVLMFCVPGLIFGGTEGVGSRFHILRALTHFRQCLVRRVTISCFARPFSFLEEPRALGPVFMFCSPDSFSAVPRAFSPVLMFCPPDSFSAVPRASGPVFMFCAPGLIFGCIEGVGSFFHVKRARSRFWRYRGRRVSFLCFALPDSFSAVSRAFDPAFMFCALGLIFGGTKGVGSRFHVLHAQARFRHYRGHQVTFSCFACLD
jgi:hypothetical protein